MRNLRERVSEAYKEGRLFASLQTKLRPYQSGLKHVIYNPAARRIRLHAPKHVTPNPQERPLVERIFASYKKMKADEPNAGAVYAPSSVWQQQIETAYAPLKTALRNNDLQPFHYFLANFGAWETYHGVESTTLVQGAKSLVKKRYLLNAVFYRQLKTWHWLTRGQKPLSALSYPTHGNQSGAYIDGHFVGVGSFFNEIYGSLLAGLVDDQARPVLAELGAGYGKLAYAVLRNLKAFVYLDFDLPEVVCLAAYFLMLSFPEKRFLLYGEKDYSPAQHKAFDFILMPCWEIERLGTSTVDLFINTTSLGEMKRDSVTHYIPLILQASHYFFHLNHESRRTSFGHGETSLVASEYPIPADQFKLLFRYPDMNHLLYQGFLDYTMDIFLYLYERRR